MASVALWLTVAAYGALVIRHFFHLSGSAVYLSTDDGLANISYALATEGRYGFLSSPVLLDMARDHGLFSYGPYYFFVGAALIWLFGYSLILIRSIHLAVIVGIVLAARAWFGRGAGRAAAAIAAVGLLVAFDRAQWPMVRPDSMVSLFAVALVVSAGLALRTGRARYWWWAGFAAACGAFTHLVAWSLVPSVVVIIGIGAFADAVGDDRRWRRPRVPWGPLVAAATGGFVGAFLFYASFGFRFKDQLRFLTGYQELTGSMAAMSAPGSAYRDLILQHFKLAYWFLPYPLGKLVWPTLAISLGVVLLTLWRGRDRKHQILAVIAPPVVVWSAYLLSLGVYNNFHAGYAILNQVMWLWTLAALGTVVLENLDRWPRLQRTAAVLAWTTAMVLGVGVLTLFAQRTEYRALADASFVPIDEYTNRILEPLPARARSWGSVVFGVEHPGRIQLVQFKEGVEIVNSLVPADRAPLAPDYLVWGFAENRNNIITVLAGANQQLPVLAGLFPQTRYSLVSLTAAAPYGVTRVYARQDGAPGLDRPLLNVYEPAYRQWNSALGSPAAVRLTPVPAARLQLGEGAQVPVRTAAQTLSGELPADIYLLRVNMASTLTPADSAIVMATPTADIRDAFGQFGPEFDASPWFAGERAVYLVYRHRGGPVYISQFGTRLGAMTGVEASKILPLTDYKVIRRGAPVQHPMPANQWVPSYPEIRLTPIEDGTVAVAGNTVQYGYQAYGPRIPVEPGQRMMLRVAVTVSKGNGCLGVLDGTGMRWLLAPDTLKPDYEFQINDSRTVRPVLADCSTSPKGIVPVEAVIGPGSYAVWSDKEDLYVDLLMRARQDPAR